MLKSENSPICSVQCTERQPGLYGTITHEPGRGGGWGEHTIKKPTDCEYKAKQDEKPADKCSDKFLRSHPASRSHVPLVPSTVLQPLIK